MFKRFVYVMLLLMMVNHCQAQVLSAKVGINGLTCSQCSRSVEIQLRKLSFVKNVNMNLASTEGTLQFKEGSDIDFLKIAKAVKDAGFSVRFLDAEIDMQKVKMHEKGFTIGNDLYLFPDAKNIQSANAKFRFLGKMFSSGKNESNTNESPAKGHVYSLKLAS
ncbi:heavy-metal-associated domain-containing protein [Taibaiella lutea]|nr:cation transporter [Taibaiella lutea]